MIYNASLHLFGDEFNKERQKHERSRVGRVINVQKYSAFIKIILQLFLTTM
jgi:hypothetical protein